MDNRQASGACRLAVRAHSGRARRKTTPGWRAWDTALLHGGGSLGAVPRAWHAVQARCYSAHKGGRALRS